MAKKDKTDDHFIDAMRYAVGISPVVIHITLPGPSNYKLLKVKRALRLKNPKVGQYYRVNYHASLLPTTRRPDMPEVGEYVQILSIDPRTAHLDKFYGRKGKVINYKNLNTGVVNYFEQESIMAGRLSEVSETEVLLYVKDLKSNG